MQLPDPFQLPDLPVRAALGAVTDALAAPSAARTGRSGSWDGSGSRIGAQCARLRRHARLPLWTSLVLLDARTTVS